MKTGEEPMSRIGVIHNPFARKNMKQPSLGNKLKVILGDRGELFETQHVDQLEGVARTFMEKELDLLAVNGGDGSLHSALTAFVNVFGEKPLPKLVILRGGTMNTVSNSLRLKGRPESILAKLVAGLESGRDFPVTRQQLLRVNDTYGFITGIGVISKFLDVYYSGSRTGPLKAMEMVVKLILSVIFRTRYARHMFAEAPMYVSVDGKDLGKESYMAVLGSTVREVGLGFALTHRANDKPGCFHCIASSISPMALLPKLFFLWAGRDIRHPDLYHHGLAGEMLIEPAGELRWMMDGEMYQTRGALRVSVGPVVDVLRV